MKPNQQTIPFALLAALMSGCTIIETVPPPDGDDEYVLACTKVNGRSSCDAQAKALCPAGFDILASEENFDRKDLRIRCTEGGGAR